MITEWMISSSSDFNNNKKPDICATVCNVLCAAQRCAFQGQRQRVAKVLRKCCTTLESASVCAWVCVCPCPLMVNVKQQLLLLQVAGVLQCKCQANGDWQQSMGDWQLACAACRMLPAGCHLPLATCRATSWLCHLRAQSSSNKFKWRQRRPSEHKSATVCQTQSQQSRVVEPQLRL